MTIARNKRDREIGCQSDESSEEEDEIRSVYLETVSVLKRDLSKYDFEIFMKGYWDYLRTR